MNTSKNLDRSEEWKINFFQSMLIHGTHTMKNPDKPCNNVVLPFDLKTIYTVKLYYC